MTSAYNQGASFSTPSFDCEGKAPVGSEKLNLYGNANLYEIQECCRESDSVHLERIVVAGAVRAAAFVTPRSLVASIADEIACFQWRANVADVPIISQVDSDVCCEKPGWGWKKVFSCPFSSFGGAATGLSILRVADACEKPKIEHICMVAAFGVRKLRLLRVAYLHRSNSGDQSLVSDKTEAHKIRKNHSPSFQSSMDGWHGAAAAAGAAKADNLLTLFPIHPTFVVDDLVLDVKCISLKCLETDDIESNLSANALLCVGFAHNYIDIFDLTWSRVERDSKECFSRAANPDETAPKKLTPLCRVQCHQQSLLYSLELCILNQQPFPEMKSTCNSLEGSHLMIEVAAGTVENRVIIWSFFLSDVMRDHHKEMARLNAGEKSKRNQVFPLTPSQTFHVEQTHTYEGHRGVIFKIHYFEEGKVLCTVSDDREVRVWGRQTTNIHQDNQRSCGTIPRFELQASLKGHLARVWDVTYLSLHNKNFLITVGEDSQSIIWDIRGTKIKQLLGHFGRGIRSVAASDDGNLVATGGEDGDLKVWRLSSFIPSHLHPNGNEEGLKEEADDYFEFDVRAMGNEKDWIRDIILDSHSSGLLITNFGGLGFFTFGTSTNVALMEKQLATDSFEMRYFERCSDIFTCMALSQPIQCRNGFLESRDRALVIGTAEGMCRALSLKNVESHLQVMEQGSLERSTVWAAFQSSRVQRIFAYILPSLPLSLRHTTYADKNLGTLVVATHHEGKVKLYYMSNCCSLKRLSTLADFRIQSERKEIRLFSSSLVIDTAEKLVNSSIDGKPFNAILSVTKCSLLLFLGDEQGSIHCYRIELHLKLERNADCHYLDSCNIHFFAKLSHLHGGYKLLDIKIYQSFPVSQSFEPSSRSLHPPEELFENKNDDQESHICRTFTSSIARIETLGADGRVRVSDFDYSQKTIKLTSTAQIPKLKVLWKFITARRSAKCHQAELNLKYIAAFRVSEFVLFDVENSAELWRFQCGGSRRPFSIYASPQAAISDLRSLKNHNLHVTTASVTGSRLFLRVWTDSQSLKNSETDHIKEGKSINEVSQVESCSSLIGGLHGREILCNVWITPNLLCTAGEDNTIRLLEIDKRRVNNGGSESRPGVLRCLKIFSDHPAAVRCLSVCTIQIPRTGQQDQRLKFVISGGARLAMNLYEVFDEFCNIDEVSTENSIMRHIASFHLPGGQDERIITLSSSAFILSSILPEGHLSSKDPIMTQNQMAVSLSVIIGTSAGNLILCSSNIFLLPSHLKPLEVLDHSFTWNSQPLGHSKSSINNRKLRKDCTNLSSFDSVEFIDRLPNSIQSSDWRCAGTIGDSSILAVGCCAGKVHLYEIKFDGRSYAYKSVGRYRAHQVGTNALQIVQLPSEESSVSFPSQITTLKNTSHRHSAALRQLPVLFSSTVDTIQPVLPIKHSTVVYGIVSCGDDNSLSIQLCSESLTPLGLFRQARAHRTSVRDLVTKWPYIYTVGWDKYLCIWRISWTQEDSAAKQITTKEYCLPFDPILNPDTHQTIELQSLHPLGVPDAAALSCIEVNIGLRMCVSGGASGLEIFDVTKQKSRK